MKKFLVAAALILGVVVSQFVEVPCAEAYTPQNGDVAVVLYWYCNECNEAYKQTIIHPNKYADPDPREVRLYGCHSNKKNSS